MRQIALTRGLYALVDDKDFDWLSGWKWRAHWDYHTHSFYARRNQRIAGKRVEIKMHRQILGLECGDKRHGDHANQDTLDNRRPNLRIATVAQNNQNRKIPKNNTSGSKGLVWHGNIEKWEVRIQANKSRKSYGFFHDKDIASSVCDEVRRQIHGKFARVA